jgi:ring-1,2-phenylacetyl-CoA epoxidase subunit PaaE
LTKTGSDPSILYESLTVESIREEARNFKTFTFRDGHSLKYESGQFITLVDNSGKQEIRRSYSIISSPSLDEPLAIALNV